MIVSERWLREFTEIPCSPQELSDILTMLGLEVEHIDFPAKKFDRFVVGHVLEREQHPNADKLSVCTVATGEAENRTIICGAPNVAAGQKVAVALDGAIVPAGGFEIGKRKLRGVESNGMICSRSELELGEESDGIWVLPDTAAVGLPLADYLEVNDVLYEIGITPNRADCLSHLGIAREIAAYFKQPLKMPFATSNEPASPALREAVSIAIESPEHCPRYAGKIVKNVLVKESPDWMQKRLLACGMRPRNVIVDITNYVLLECGHPLHAFDYSTLEGNAVIVKLAADGEEFVTLDSKTRKLDGQMLMICDAARPVAVAGVMGGENSEISEATTTVFIESALFAPSSIRRTAKTLDIKSEASYRFERGTDPGNVLYAVERAAALMCEYAGGESMHGTLDIVAKELPPKRITLRYKRVQDIVGISLPPADIQEILRRIYCTVVESDETAVTVMAPTFRVDIEQEIDLIEEVARLYNYDNIPPSRTASISFGSDDLPALRRPSLLVPTVGEYLRRNGYQEILTHNFTDPTATALFTDEPILLANPLGEEMSCMRPSIAIGMLKTIEHNIRHGNKNLHLYEEGTSFHNVSSEELPYTERRELCLAITGATEAQWAASERKYDFFDIKGCVEDVLEYIGIEKATLKAESQFPLLGGEAMSGYDAKGTLLVDFGAVKKEALRHFGIEQSVFLAVWYGAALEAAVRRKPKYEGISPFPTVERDIAFVVEETLAAGEMAALIEKNGGEYLRSVALFDLYQGKNLPDGKKSLAFRLHFNSPEKTLQDGDVDAAVKRIIKKAEKTFGAELRG